MYYYITNQAKRHNVKNSPHFYTDVMVKERKRDKKKGEIYQRREKDLYMQ